MHSLLIPLTSLRRQRRTNKWEFFSEFRGNLECLANSVWKPTERTKICLNSRFVNLKRKWNYVSKTSLYQALLFFQRHIKQKRRLPMLFIVQFKRPTAFRHVNEKNLVPKPIPDFPGCIALSSNWYCTFLTEGGIEIRTRLQQSVSHPTLLSNFLKVSNSKERGREGRRRNHNCVWRRRKEKEKKIICKGVSQMPKKSEGDFPRKKRRKTKTPVLLIRL